MWSSCPLDWWRNTPWSFSFPPSTHHSSLCDRYPLSLVHRASFSSAPSFLSSSSRIFWSSCLPSHIWEDFFFSSHSLFATSGLWHRRCGGKLASSADEPPLLFYLTSSSTFCWPFHCLWCRLSVWTQHLVALYGFLGLQFVVCQKVHRLVLLVAICACHSPDCSPGTQEEAGPQCSCQTYIN